MSKSLIDRAEQLLAQTKAEYAVIRDTPTGIALRTAELLRDLVADARRDDLDSIVSRLKALEIDKAERDSATDRLATLMREERAARSTWHCGLCGATNIPGGLTECDSCHTPRRSAETIPAAAPVSLPFASSGKSPDDEAIAVFAEHLAERFYKRARDLDPVDTREARFWRIAAETIREEAGLL